MWIDCNDVLVNLLQVDYITFSVDEDQPVVSIYFAGRDEPMVMEVGDLEEARRYFVAWTKNEEKSTTPDSAKS